MNAWMNSSGHRANILNDKMEYIGVGVIYQDGVYYWSQLFAVSNSLSNSAYLPDENEDTIPSSFTTTTQVTTTTEPITTNQISTTSESVTTVLTTTTQDTTTMKPITTTSTQSIAAEKTTTTNKCLETAPDQTFDFSTIIRRILYYVMN